MMTISINLDDRESIKNAKKQLRAYKTAMKKKCEEFVKQLASVGIKVGKQNCGEYAEAITFEKYIASDKDGCLGYIRVVGDPIVREWRYQGGTRQESINALLMAEFGSGWEADVRLPNVSGVGQGTFPGQTHAWDYSGWWWTDLEGNAHHSKGEKPSYPVYSAWMEMKQQINSIALQVFKNG